MEMHKTRCLLMCVCISVLVACGKKQGMESISVESEEQLVEQEIEAENQEKKIENEEQTVSENIVPEIEVEEVAKEEPQILKFVDVFGEQYEVDIIPSVEKHSYQLEGFVFEGSKLSYVGDERYTSRLGVDVSHHQGYIDWQEVKKQGIDFAFIRIGYRGYGTAGTVNLDREFDTNIKAAQDAGIDVGVYFYAQAISEAEAKEEADFVIEHLQPYQLQLPVVYDPESVLDAPARTDNVPAEQFVKNTRVFCDTVKQAGYEPMIYSNMLWEAFQFDLEALSDIPIWYADYEAKPQTPYHFTFWQYTNEGYLKGISGRVDMNIWLVPIK